MERKIARKEKSIKFKILTIPLIIIFIVVALISAIAIQVAQAKIMDQVKADGTNLGNQIAKQVGNNSSSIDALNESINTRIRTLRKLYCK